MNRDEARKILGIVEGDADLLGHFNRRKKLISERLKAAPNEALKAQYRGMLSQLERAAAALAGVAQMQSSSPKGDTTPLGISELGPGQLLADRYQVKKQMARDSIGVMLRAFDQKRNKDVVIMVIYPELLSNEYILQRFLAEARVASELYHPGIMNVTGWKTAGEYSFLIIEFLQGQTLSQLIKTRKKARKPFSTQEVIQFARAITDALNYAHIKTEHGDIRPENIWVDEKGNYKIMGFGTVQLKRAHQIKQTGNAQISKYQAPEQLQHPDIADNHVDQYALGLVMHELLTFEVPSANHKSVAIRRRRIGKNVAPIIRKMLDIKPSARFESMADISSAMSQIEPAWSLPRFRPNVIGTIMVIVIATAILFSADLSNRLARFWDGIQPLASDVKQQQFRDSIELVNEVNRLIQDLNRARTKLQAKIRDGGRTIANLEDALASARSDANKAAALQQLYQTRLELARNQNLQRLTDKIIYANSRLIRSEGKVLMALSLIENKDFYQANEVLLPVQVGLKQDLQYFNTASAYLLAHEKMLQAQNTWLRYRESQGLQAPTDVEQQQMINNTVQLAQSGQLNKATKQAEQLTRQYAKKIEADLQRVKDRARYGAQQARTQKLETEWKSYLNKRGLRITPGQQESLNLIKLEERTQLSRQEFSAAAITSRVLHQTVSDYYEASKTTVKIQLENRIAEDARRAKADRDIALAAAEQAMTEKDYNQAVKQFEKALAKEPEDKATSKQLELAKSRTSSTLLKKYAPGMTLVKIPGGSFNMGDLNRGGSSDEKPAHPVKVKSFNLMKHEVTFAQFDIYVEQTDAEKPKDEGWGRGNRPVINVNWTEASDYASWLSEITGTRFRLPSEAEWEYAARAGSETKYPWGGSGLREKANYGKDICCNGQASGPDKWVNSSPVGSFPANQFGINDMHGNVWEWVQDCWNDSYNGAPNDGSAWLSGDCKRHLLRGGSWSSVPDYLRSANRDGNQTVKRNNSLGFRLVQEQ